MEEELEVSEADTLKHRKDSKHTGSVPGEEVKLPIFMKLLSLRIWYYGPLEHETIEKLMPGIF
jgi:hypothetical protein